MFTTLIISSGASLLLTLYFFYFLHCLAEGVDGNDVVIVHEKHDGTYELISGIYDAATNTVSFATDGFSNYAIAYRTVAEAPDTGFFTSETSGAMESIIGLAVTTLGVVVALYIVSRKIKKEQ